MSLEPISASQSQKVGQASPGGLSPLQPLSMGCDVNSSEACAQVSLDSCEVRIQGGLERGRRGGGGVGAMPTFMTDTMGSVSSVSVPTTESTCKHVHLHLRHKLDQSGHP